MAKVTYTVCDRCEAKSMQENVKISGFSFDKKTLDLCHKCQDELKALFNHSIHARLLAGAKALEDLADDRAAELCGCSSSHLAESLREIEENIGGGI
jgi:hypothetical protein